MNGISSNRLAGTGLNWIQLGTLTESGKPPETRLTEPQDARAIVDALIRANEKRAETDAFVKGLVDGNPPYSKGDMRKHGTPWRTNVNWREAESFFNTALSAYYDVIHEVPTLAEVSSDYGSNRDDRVKWSRIMTEEFDKLNKADESLDYEQQLSQHDMVLYRCGPMMWEDTLDYRSRSVKCQNVYVPDGTPSNVNRWEMCLVVVDYNPGELYQFIKNPKIAKEMGWNVEAVKQAIMNAAPREYMTNQQSRQWPWWQQRLTNNDLSFTTSGSVISVGHLFYREFPKPGQREGHISQASIVMPSAAQSARTQRQTKDKTFDEFLYHKVGRFQRWQQVICPFYFDKGDGTHHSVKGIGIKFYSAFEVKNRLKCALVDAAFARGQLHLQALDENSMQTLQIAQFGPYAILPANLQANQTQLQQAMDGPMSMDQDLMNTVTSNLSMYRQGLQEKSGNPITAKEADIRAASQANLNKTQLTRYYEQADDFLAERFRRAANPNLTEAIPCAREALAFQQACFDRGVPKAALQKVRVKATRVAGQGSAYLRKLALQETFAILPMLPEQGRENLITDTVAANLGVNMVDRYYPSREQQKPTQDNWDAVQENASIKIGAPVVWTPEQNNVIHAQTHLQAGAEALNALQQGGKPIEVAAFVAGIIDHVPVHLQVIAQDPTRVPVFEILEEQFNQLSALSDDLQKLVAKQMQAEQQAMAENERATQQVMNEEERENFRTQQAEQRANAKTMTDIQRKNAKLQQQMASKDIQLAEKIRNDRTLTQAKVAQSKATPKNGA